MNTKIKLLIVLLTLVSNELLADSFYYRASFNDDPATTINIGWSGPESNEPSDYTIYWDCVDHGTDISQYKFSCTPETETRRYALSHFFKKLTGLQPKTVYYFVIKDNKDGTISPRMSIMTLSDNANDPLSFISGGDTRTGFPGVEPCNCRNLRKKGNEIVAKIRPDVVFFNGDYVLNQLGFSTTVQEWKDWFEDWQLTISEDGRLYPLIVSLGNHENKGEVRDMFNMPNEDMYFGLNFHGNLFRLYTLNTEVNACSNTEQLNWFKNDLEMFDTPGNEVYWKLVQYHIPMIPQGFYSDKNDIIDCWMPLFEEHNVRLSMESHTHIYKVTHPIKASNNNSDPTYHKGFVRSDADGVMFIGEGNWGAPFRSIYSLFPWSIDVERNFSSFFYITINKEKIRISTVDFDTDLAQVEDISDNELGSCLPDGVKLYSGNAGTVYELCASGTDCLDNSSICDMGSPSSTGNCDSLSTFGGCAFTGGTEDTSVVSGILQNLSEKKFAEVYPNPVVDHLTVKFFKPQYKTTIEVYNALGKQCKVVKVNNGQLVWRLNVNDFCEGVNFLYIRDKEGIQVHKLIKR